MFFIPLLTRVNRVFPEHPNACDYSDKQTKKLIGINW